MWPLDKFSFFAKPRQGVLSLDYYSWFNFNYDAITTLLETRGYSYHKYDINDARLTVCASSESCSYRDIDLDSAIAYTVCNELEILPGIVDLNNDIHRSVIEKWRAIARSCVEYTLKVVSEKKITVFLLPQGYVLEAAICRLVAINLGLQIFAIENTLHNDRLLWDNISGITVNYNLSRNYFWKYKDSIKLEAAEAYAINYLRNIKQFKAPEHTSPTKILNFPQNKKIVVFLAQVYTDSSVLFNIYNFIDPVHIIEILTEYCFRNDCALVIKLHPKEISGNSIVNTPLDRLTWRKLSASERFRKIYNNSSDITVDYNNDYDTFMLIQSSDVCVTVNSMSGLEACLYNKPVINCGHASYSGLGFTSEAQDEGLLIYFLDRMLKDPSVNTNIAMLFFYIFLDRYCIKKDEATLVEALTNR